MRKISILFVTILFLSRFISAHVHWVDVDPVNPEVGSLVKVMVCSGHEFPQSGFAISAKMIHKVFVCGAGNSEVITVSPGKRCHVGEYAFLKPGIYKAGFVIKKPQMKNPLYFSCTLVNVGGVNAVDKFPQLPNGLEIVAPLDLFQKKKGDSLVFKVVKDGKPVPANCEITVAGKKHSFVKSDDRGEFSIPVKRYGKYLITTSFQRVGCSLTFLLNPDKVGN